MTNPTTRSLGPTLEVGVRGPRGAAGLRLQAPNAEAMVWDLENEIASARRFRLSNEEGWWIASSYFDTVLDIVLRFFPSVRILYSDTGEERVLHAAEPLEEGGV